MRPSKLFSIFSFTKYIPLIALGGIGLILLLIGGNWGVKRALLAWNGVQTQGTVIEILESISSSSSSSNRSKASSSYYPIVEFTAQNNHTYKIQGSTGGGKYEYSLDQKVDLIYDPKNPQGAQLKDFSQLWLGPVVVSIFGLIFLGAGLGAHFIFSKTDEEFGAAFHEPFNRMELYDDKKGLKVMGVIQEVKVEKKRGKNVYTLICQTQESNGQSNSYSSIPLSFDPSQKLLGQSVEIYIDPYDSEKYYIHLEPLLASHFGIQGEQNLNQVSHSETRRL